MSAAVERLLAVARSQLGTVEAPPGSNRTRYGAAYGMDEQPWCAMFVWWCFGEAGLAPLIPKTAYTPTFAQWFKDRGRWGGAPRPGALPFFDFPGDGLARISHIALCEAVNRDGSIVTIEGNTSSGASGSQRDGGGVYRRTRKSGIVGYAYPDYPTEALPAGTPSLVFPPAAPVSPVRLLQVVARVADDGIWGPVTDRALGLIRDAARGRLHNIRDTQRAVGALADGLWGPRSRAALAAVVRTIQGALGVTVDGDWGPITDQAFLEARTRYGVGL